MKVIAILLFILSGAMLASAFFPQIYAFFKSEKGNKLIDANQKNQLEDINFIYSFLEFGFKNFIGFSVSYVYFFLFAMTFCYAWHLFWLQK